MGGGDTKKFDESDMSEEEKVKMEEYEESLMNPSEDDIFEIEHADEIKNGEESIKKAIDDQNEADVKEDEQFTQEECQDHHDGN